MLEGAADVRRIRDAEFAKMLKDAPSLPDFDGDADPTPLALLDAPVPAVGPAADMAMMHRIAANVLRGIGTADITSKWECDVGGIAITVHFDGCSHSSGKQRAYVACKGGDHSACFRYATVDRFPSEQECVATLACWSVEPKKRPKGWTKEDHKKIDPSNAEVAALLPSVRILE